MLQLVYIKTVCAVNKLKFIDFCWFPSKSKVHHPPTSLRTCKVRCNFRSACGILVRTLGLSSKGREFDYSWSSCYHQNSYY